MTCRTALNGYEQMLTVCCCCHPQVVQEIKMLRANVSQREREKAERATLKEQERLIKAKVATAPHPNTSAKLTFQPCKALPF